MYRGGMSTRTVHPAYRPPGAGGGPSSDLPSVFAAVEEQLGLKLEPRREPADVLVIESADPPAED